MFLLEHTHSHRERHTKNAKLTTDTKRKRLSSHFEYDSAWNNLMNFRAKKSNYCMNYLAEKVEQMACNVKLWSATVFSNIQLELFDYYFFPVSCILI